MKIFGILLTFVLLFSCAELTKSDPAPPPYPEGPVLFGDLDSFGSDSTLDIMTWNVEHFPKSYQNTVEYMAHAIVQLKVDVVSLQEIESTVYFNNLVNQLNELDSLNHWVGFRSGSVSSYWGELAYLINDSNIVIVDNPVTIINSDSLYFAYREPYMIRCGFASQDVYIINNHFKCCGDGLIDWGNADDEEYRRLIASSLIRQYIDENLSNEQVIVLGDLNDEIQDAEENNVFMDFISAPEDYLFTDMEIAQGSSFNWSYPTWPSHIDHILITNELFDSFSLTSSTVQTLRLDDYLDGGWGEYDLYLSDHRPIALKLDLD